MSTIQIIKEKLVAHLTEALLTAAGTVIPGALLLAESRLTPIVKEIPTHWLIRSVALLLAVTLFLAAFVFYRRTKLTFIEDLGVYFDKKKNLHICPKCLSLKKRSWLRNEEHGFRCTVCNKYFSDPKRPIPLPPGRRIISHGIFGSHNTPGW